MKPRVLLVSLALLLIGTGYVLRPEPVTVTLHALRDPETVFWSGRLALLRGMVVLGFLFAVHQCFSTI